MSYSYYTKDDIRRMVEEEDVEFIRLQFTDIFGTLKNVAITASQLERALEGQCTFDGSAVRGFARIEDSDMVLIPDPDTFTIFPWRPQQGKVARMFCNVCHYDGTPFEGDPRQILKQVIQRAEQMGYTLDVGPELEFFMFQTDDQGRPDVRIYEKAGYCDVGPTDNGENFRRDMVLTLEDMGYEVAASHHENAPGQHEIDFMYGEALKTADDIMTYKLAIRTIARRHGMQASFMPKPIHGICGSGMHLNMSLRNREGVNIFTDDTDSCRLSPEGRYFIGGIMKHIRGMTAVLNPLVNSYKRFVSHGFEAPVYISWSAHNRTPLIRIPMGGVNTRVELRSPDPSTNPYTALAVCLAAGLDGIENRILPPPESRGNIFANGEEMKLAKLPVSLGEALGCMQEDPFVMAVLGKEYTEAFLEVKNKEWERYCEQVHQWELDTYLTTV